MALYLLTQFSKLSYFSQFFHQLSLGPIDNGTLPPSSNNANHIAINSNNLSSILYTPALVKRAIRRLHG